MLQLYKGVRQRKRVKYQQEGKFLCEKGEKVADINVSQIFPETHANFFCFLHSKPLHKHYHVVKQQPTSNSTLATK